MMKQQWKQAVAVIGITVLLSAMMLGGCGKTTKTEKTDGTSDFKGEFIISAKEAKEKLGDKNVLFIDGRGEPSAKKGTIEGAPVTDWTSLSTCQEGKAGDENWGLVPEPTDLTNRLQALGIDKEKEILRIQAINEGKPEKIVNNMVEGRIKKYFKEVCLLDQPFVKDPDKSIADYVKEQIAALGENITIRRFTRYEMGEGLQKREDNFVEEVMNQAKA